MELIIILSCLVAFVVIGYISFWILWILFRIVMWMKNDLLVKYPSGIRYWLIMSFGGAFTIFAILFDIAFNIIYGTPMFDEMPHYKRLTLSARMAHILYFEDHDDLKWKRANKICTELLEPYDAGHCEYNIWVDKD